MQKTIESIDEAFSDFLAGGAFTVDKLSQLVIPTPREVICDILYVAARRTTGQRIAIEVNGKQAVDLRYDSESGEKKSQISLTGVLAPGVNDFRVLCLVSATALGEQSDAALVWLRSSAGTVIRKKYATKNMLEPFDQHWSLLVA